MAGELSALAELTTIQIASLAAIDTYAMQLYNDTDPGPYDRWPTIRLKVRQDYRRLAAKLIKEAYDTAADCDRG